MGSIPPVPVAGVRATRHARPFRPFLSGLAAALLLVAGCVDGTAPTDPDGLNAPSFTPTAQLHIAPRFAATGSSGQAASAPAAQSASAAAAAETFDRIACFVLVATRVADGEMVAEETFQVTPGQDEYRISAEVELAGSSDTFRVELTAYAAGEGGACGLELFSGTREITVHAESLSGGDDGGEVPQSTTLDLTPSGPAAEAASLELAPGFAVLSGGGTLHLEATLLDDQGGVIEDGDDLAEILLWGSDGPAASVESGLVTGASDGITNVTASTVTGLTATIPVYVATGELAYVSGGNVVRARVDGSGSRVAASGGDRPAWSPDGAILAYDAGGSIRTADGTTLLSGAGSPTFAPDGAHVTGYGGGLVHATVNGVAQAGPVDGPSSPRWLDGSTLVGDGDGGLVRVSADGTGLTALTEESSDRLPAVGGGGIYFLSARDGGTTGVFRLESGGGATRITPDGFTASGRPSVAGAWILVPGTGPRGSGLHLAPSDGSGEPLPLPIGGGDWPAWRPSGSVSPPVVSVSGVSPEHPTAGIEVTISGSGFDTLVPGANSVQVPVLGGAAAAAPTSGAAGAARSGGSGSATAVAAEILSVTSSRLTFLAPPDITTGPLTVSNGFDSATFEIEPATGSLRLNAITPAGKAVEGVHIQVSTDAGEVVTSGKTDSEGTVLFADLLVGFYDIAVAAPDGFQTPSEVTGVEVVVDQTTAVELDIGALPWSVTTSASSLHFARTLLTETVGVTVLDIDGDLMEAELSVERVPASVVQARILGPGALELEGRAPGSAVVKVRALPVAGFSPTSGPAASSGEEAAEAAPSASIDVQVDGGVSGTVSLEDGTPVGGATLRLLLGEETLRSTRSLDDGTFGFSSLEPGDYSVIIEAPRGYVLVGANSISTPLSSVNPRPRADFVLQRASSGVGGGDLVVFNDTNIFDDRAMESAGNQRMVSNLVGYSGSGFRAADGTVVWSDNGHSPRRVSGGSIFGSVIADEGMRLQAVNSSLDVSLAEIPPEVKVILLWTPQQAYTVSEINGLKRFAEDGGRIVFIGEYEGFYPSTYVQSVQNPLLSAMGTGMINIGGAYDGGFTTLPQASIRPHQVTEGVSSFVHAASSAIALGESDSPLFYDSTNTHLVAGVGPVDTTPLGLEFLNGLTAIESTDATGGEPEPGMDLRGMTDAELQRAAAGLAPLDADTGDVKQPSLEEGLPGLQ